MFRLFGLSAIFASALILGGCGKCDRLVERLCSDLGAEDCAVWTEIGGPDKTLPAGRRGRACGNIANNDKAYQGTLYAARGAVLSHRLNEAVKAGDVAAMEAIKVKLDANTKASLALVP